MVRLTLEELKRRVDQLYETLGGNHPVVFVSERKSSKRFHLKWINQFMFLTVQILIAESK